MDEKIPEPLSKPVEPTKPGANIPPASATPNATVSSTPMGMPASNVGKSGGGKKVLVVLLVLVLMASTAAFGYLWWQARSAQAQLAQAQTDKEAAEKKASEAEAKLSAVTVVDDSSNSKGYLVISEMGVKLKLPEGVQDLEYYYNKDTKRAYLGSKSLTVEAEKTKADTCYVKSGPLGEIEERSTAYPANRNKPADGNVVTITGKYYGFLTPDVGCPGGAVANSAELQKMATSQLEVVTQAFQSLEKN